MQESKKIKVGVVGITGYGGGELARILLNHPSFLLTYGSAGKDRGLNLADVHPQLRGLCDLILSPHPEKGALGGVSELDALFLAMPHGKSMELMPHLPEHIKIVDLAGDYRLKDRDVFEKNYGVEHSDFSRVAQVAYGLTEVNREKIVGSRCVANPGCFATAVQLAIYPFVKGNYIDRRIIIDAKTGSSGSGVGPKPTTHHPFRDGSFYAYKMFSHQHLPEIDQTLTEVQFDADLIFQVHSAPMVRGIFASCYMELKKNLSGHDLKDILLETYDSSPFVRILDGSPNVQWVRQSNFADIGFSLSGKNLVVFCAIDNLVKGASGQAVQNMNLMFGLQEHDGLLTAGGCPG